MRKLLKIVFIAVVGMQLSTLSSFAETKAAKPAQEAQKQEAQKQEVKTIFNYKSELGLTDKQSEDMKTLVSKLQTTLNEKGKEISELRQGLSQMIKNKDALSIIRPQLKKIADLQVDISYSDIETARKIEGVLTPAQMKKWQDIQLSSLDKLKAESTKTTKK